MAKGRELNGQDTPLSTAMLRQLRLDLLEAAVLQYDSMAARSQTRALTSIGWRVLG